MIYLAPSNYSFWCSFFFFFCSIDYVEEIFQTFLEANQQKGTLSNAAKELREATPLPMNSMLTKEPKESALLKKQKRKSMVVEDVPPTVPCEYKFITL